MGFGGFRYRGGVAIAEMNHQDHVRLITKGIPAGTGGVWADVGAGRGAFTLALAELLSPGSTIHTIDQDDRALKVNQQMVQQRYPEIMVQPVPVDFTRPFSLPLLDGLVMANALHFVRRKEPVVHALRDCLRPGGRFVIVEYDTRRGNRWVPYPLTFEDWVSLAETCGFKQTTLLATRPSSFLGQFFSALSVK